jgi:hypothetical protein
MGAMRKRPKQCQKKGNGLSPSVTSTGYPLNNDIPNIRSLRKSTSQGAPQLATPARPEAFTSGHLCGAPLSHPARHVQHQLTSRRAALGVPQAPWARRGARGSSGGGGQGGGDKRTFILPIRRWERHTRGIRRCGMPRCWGSPTTPPTLRHALPRAAPPGRLTRPERSRR